MGLVFEAIATEGLAHIAYLIGDSSSGTAALIDPAVDVDRYLALAQSRRVTITHIFETHVPSDMVSGSRELQAHLPNAKICLSWEGVSDYKFPHLPVHDGDRFAFGDLVITARHTPGPTPEHMAYLLSEKRNPHSPWGVCTGDSLLLQSAGRVDLLGSEQAPLLAEKLYQTMQDFYLPLPDGILIYPCHSKGSPCGLDIGQRPVTTLGYERIHNPYLHPQEKSDFCNFAQAAAPPLPSYFQKMRRINSEGPAIIGHSVDLHSLSAAAFQHAIDEEDTVVIDTRDMFAFGAGHIAGALNLGAAPMMSLWGGWFIDPEKRILLIVDEHEKDNVVRYLRRTGFTHFAGYLEGGMSAWSNAGYALQQIPQRSVQQLREAGNNLQLVDVRTSAEHEKGYIPGALHIPLARLLEQISKLNPEKATAVYCGQGYRASLATSLLRQQGFKNINNIPGSWKAWREAGFPVAGLSGDTVCIPSVRIPKIVLRPTTAPLAAKIAL